MKHLWSRPQFTHIPGVKATFALMLALTMMLPLTLKIVEARRKDSETVMVANEFSRLVADYVSDLYSRHPLLAASSGLHSWDDRLEDYSASAISDEIASIKGFQSRLDRIHALSLELSDLFDHEILTSNMKSRLLELESIKNYERNPQIYSDIISNSLLFLAIFDYAPAETRLASITAKEKQIPRFLAAAQSNLHNSPGILLKTGLASLRGTLTFVQSDLPPAFASVHDPKLQGEFRKATASAAEALASFIKHVEHMKPAPDAGFALGTQRLEAKLKFDDGIDIPVEQLLAIAYRELNRTQEEFKKTAKLIDARRDPMAVWVSIQTEHPQAGTLVAEARKQLETLVRFIRERKIVTLPTERQPVVGPSPDFMRWSTASEWGPGAFAGSNVPARYFITDVDPKWNQKEREEYLGSINYQQLWTTSIHEAYPGHFVQDEFLKSVGSVVRKSAAFAPVSFVEGWAHYTEQMMIDEGFGGGDPKLKMGQLADALLRICRTVVGVREHTQGMTVEQGTRFFMENGFMGETPARLEAERGAFDPSYILYTIGKLAILKLRADYKRARGSDYSLQEFHDRLLSTGLAPLWIHRQKLLPDDKSKLLD